MPELSQASDSEEPLSLSSLSSYMLLLEFLSREQGGEGWVDANGAARVPWLHLRGDGSLVVSIQSKADIAAGMIGEAEVSALMSNAAITLTDECGCLP